MKHSTQNREKQLQNWLQSLPDYVVTDLQAASADASFRRYFRFTDANTLTSYIVMDAPPDKEDCTPFVHITELIRQAGVQAPQIFEQDLEQGFLLLSDLGDQPYLDHLSEAHADTLYSEAITALVRMQSIQDGLPAYDETRLRDEMALFESWYLNRHFNIELDKQQSNQLESIFKLLVESAQQQPQVFVHRDYHSRNLMLTEHNNPGVIDFQDAVIGPLSYDLVSLLKDCYIEWPRHKVETWLDDYLLKSGRAIDRNRFIRWFDLMGVQRHLKVLGIFARLNYRDGKAQYLDDLPLTLKYVVDSCHRYEELEPLLQLLKQTVLRQPGQGIAS